MGGQQSNCARPKSKIDDTENPTVISVSPPVLTAKEKGLLTESWKLLEQKVASVGVIAFTGQVFHACLRDVWHFVRVYIFDGAGI